MAYNPHLLSSRPSKVGFFDSAEGLQFRQRIYDIETEINDKLNKITERLPIINMGFHADINEKPEQVRARGLRAIAELEESGLYNQRYRQEKEEKQRRKIAEKLRIEEEKRFAKEEEARKVAEAKETERLARLSAMEEERRRRFPHARVRDIMPIISERRSDQQRRAATVAGMMRKEKIEFKPEFSRLK